MSALASFLRQRVLEDVRQLSAAERIRLALSLGDEDLRMFCAAAGVDAAAARRKLAAARQTGRRVSGAASPP